MENTLLTDDTEETATETPACPVCGAPYTMSDLVHGHICFAALNTALTLATWETR